jgi:hypothetical protein
MPCKSHVLPRPYAVEPLTPPEGQKDRQIGRQMSRLLQITWKSGMEPLPPACPSVVYANGYRGAAHVRPATR